MTADAVAVVVLVRGDTRPNTDTIVTGEVYRDIGQVPVAFKLTVDPADIDPSVTYTLQATIVDGALAWVTGHGTKVLTNGAPTTDVAIELSYRPDLVKGAVTGQITAVGMQPAADSYSIAVLVDGKTGDSLGIDVQETGDGLPSAFSIPFAITDIDPLVDYLVKAEVGDSSGATWQNAAGVPVITKGKPKAAVQVVVAEVLNPSPAPTASPPPAPEPVPATDTSGLLIVVLIGAAVAIAAAVIARLRSTSSTTLATEPATDGTPPDGAPADGDEPPAPPTSPTAG